MTGVVALFGLKNAGKKTLIAILKEQGLSGFPGIFKFVFQELDIQIVDLGSKKAVWLKLLGDNTVKLVVYMLDGFDKKSLVPAKQEFLKILRFIKNTTIPILILINKIDLDISPDLTLQIINDFKLLQLVDRKWLVHKISVKTTNGVKEALQWIYESLTGNKFPSSFLVKDLLVFSSTGILIGKAGKGSIKDPHTQSSLLAALEVVAKESLDHTMDALTLGTDKIVFGRKKDLIGVIVTNRDSNTSFTKDIINHVLEEIEAVEKSEIQRHLTLFLGQFSETLKTIE
ncbi:MAG: ADP-ribosylation factor-like protein [Candidatus Hermodarchaeota archaeon]